MYFRCVEDQCNLIPLHDNGYSEIIEKWCFVGPVQAKEEVRLYAERLIIEAK